MSKCSSWYVDKNAIVTIPPGAEGFPRGDNQGSMEYLEFQMFKEMRIYPLDTWGPLVEAS